MTRPKTEYKIMCKPFTGDYVQLDYHPLKVFTLVIGIRHNLGNGVFIVSDLDGDKLAVTRCKELDTNVLGLYPRKGWRQVELPTNTAPASY